jgi:glycosyltransferase involved in cell wall biosynthesis
MSRPTKILFLTTSTDVGGAERALLMLVANINRDLFEPVVVSVRPEGLTASRVRAAGIRMYSLRMTSGLDLNGAVQKLRSIVEQEDPEIVQSWMYHADALTAFLRWSYPHITIVWGVRNTSLSLKHTRLTTIATMLVCSILSRRVPKRIVACSTNAVHIHKRYGYDPSKWSVVLNGVDFNEMYESNEERVSQRKALGVAPSEFLVAVVGRDDPQKNHPGALASIAEARHEIPHIKCVMAGKGLDRTNERLTRLIRKLNLEKCVQLLGQCEQVRQIYNAADVLLMSSTYGEAFPNVVAEAMACGLPCIVTDIGDAALIVGNEDNVIARYHKTGMAQKIVSYVKRDASTISRERELCIRRIQEQFSLQRYVANFERQYSMLMNEKLS